MFFLIAAAAVVATPQAETVDPRGVCPAAYIDYEYYHRKYRDDTYVPIGVQLDARDGLRKCAKAGIKVPYTVAEYNKQARAFDARDVEALRYARPLYTGEESPVRP